MSPEKYQPARLFTIDEANAMLPLVKAIVRDLAELSQRVIERRHRVTQLAEGREPIPGDPYAEELAQIQQDLEKDTEQLRQYARELHELGVEPKSGPEGLVDFPSLMDGRIVYLCWRLGEPEVAHWHELDAGFAGRQALSPESAIQE